MRLTHRLDATHVEVRDALRRLGWHVTSLSAVGGGCPDLLAARSGRVVVVEVKTGKGKLRAAQEVFRATYPGEYVVLRSAAEAIQFSRAREAA